MNTQSSLGKMRMKMPKRVKEQYEEKHRAHLANTEDVYSTSSDYIDTRNTTENGAQGTTGYTSNAYSMGYSTTPYSYVQGPNQTYGISSQTGYTYGYTPGYTDTTNAYSATNGYSTTGYPDMSATTGYTGTTGYTATTGVTGTTGYTGPTGMTDTTGYTNGTTSYTGTTGYSVTQSNESYSGATGTSSTGNPSYTSESYSYFTKGTTQTETTAHKRKKVRVRVPKGKGGSKKAEAARILLHSNGRVAGTDVVDESIDAIEIEPATTGDCESIDLSIKNTVPFQQMMKPVNAVPKPDLDNDDTTFGGIEPQAIRRSRFQGHSAFSESDDESTEAIDSTTVTDSSSTFASSDVIPRGNGDEEDSLVMEAEADPSFKAFSEMEAKARKAADKEKRLSEYKEKLAKSIRDGTTPPSTVEDTTVTADLSTAERDIRMEEEIANWEHEMAIVEKSPEERAELFPASRRFKVANQQERKLVFVDSDDEDGSKARRVMEEDERISRKQIYELQNGMRLFTGKFRATPLQEIDTQEIPDDDELAMLKAAEKARREEEARRTEAKIMAIHKRTGRDIDEIRKEEEQRRIAAHSFYIDQLPPSEQKKYPNATQSTYGGTNTTYDEYSVHDYYTDDETTNIPTNTNTNTNTNTSTNSTQFGLTTVSELVSATSGSGQFVEAASGEKGVDFVEVTETISSTGTGTQDRHRQRQRQRQRKPGEYSSASYTADTQDNRRKETGLTTVSELVSATSGSGQFVEASGNDGVTYVEVSQSEAPSKKGLTTDGLTTVSEYVPANASSADYVLMTASEAKGPKQQRRRRPNIQTDGLTTVSELITATDGSGQYVETSGPDGVKYVEVPMSTTATDMTTGVSEYVTATEGETGPLFVSTAGTTTDGNDAVVLEEEDEYDYEEEYYDDDEE